MHWDSKTLLNVPPQERLYFAEGVVL
jgi:hypothetical protein